VLDAALIAWLALAALQLVPLNPASRSALSPASVGIDRALRLDAPADPRLAPRAPLSIDAASTVWALAAAVSVVVVFWSARRILARRSPRTILRGVAAAGLIAAPLAMAQHVVAPKLLYGYVLPSLEAPFPIRPS